MKNNQQNKISLPFLLAIANLLAAFSGGSVLTLAISCQAVQEEVALIAVMMGSVIGLVLVILLNSIKTKWVRTSRKAGGLLSFGGALVSLILVISYSIHINHPVQNDRWDWDIHAVHLLLCLLFSLLFVPRVLRSDTIAGDKQKIGWVEFCYSIGMVLGLASWMMLSKPNKDDFRRVLYFNIGFQILAGLIDFYSSRLSQASITNTPSLIKKDKNHLPLNWDIYIKVTIAAIALAVGIQVVAFVFSGSLGDPIHIICLAAFYFGAAVAGLLYSSIKTNLEFQCAASEPSKIGTLTLRLLGRTRRISFIFASGLVALPLFAAITISLYRQLNCHENMTLPCWSLLTIYPQLDCHKSVCPIEQNPAASATVVFLVIAAAFLFEWLVLALLNLIGAEAKQKGREGLVAVTFGTMGIGGAAGIALLSQLNASVFSYFGWMIALIVCIVVANVAIRLTNRSSLPAPVLQSNK
jgi:hypothetical protein